MKFILQGGQTQVTLYPCEWVGLFLKFGIVRSTPCSSEGNFRESRLGVGILNGNL